MSNNSFTGTLPPSIGNATSLMILNLWGQRGGGFGGHIPKEISKLVNLFLLYLNNNNFIGGIPPELGNMVSLQYLDLESNNLNGTSPKEIGKLVNLNLLYLNNNSFRR